MSIRVGKTKYESQSYQNRLPGKIETLDLRIVLFGPIEIRRKADELLIDFHAANTRTATQGWIENLDVNHLKSLLFK